LASAESIDENRTISEAAAIATRSFDRVTRNLPQGEHKANIPEPQDGCFKTTDAVAGSAWVVLGLTSRSICPRRHQSCLSQRACGMRTEESFEVSKGEIGPQPQAFCDGFDDWVVTPRRGKAVEINALWYNALGLLAGWVRQVRGDHEAKQWEAHAEETRVSFNRRFWYEQGGYLFDVVDGEQGDDTACRPNQLLAISLAHPVLDRRYWEPVVNIVQQRLLTPVGLRSLSPDHPSYNAKYDGNLRARDAAYHQGTVWAWLIGPFIDAWLKVHPDKIVEARQFLSGFDQHLNDSCIGSISEIFDAEAPFTPRGCIAQAWSVAEVLRCWVKTAPIESKNMS
jgi:hypothetical protein